MHAFITTRLDYCNHLYFGLPKYKVKKLQQIQNIAARFISGARKFDHITLVLVQLHWLPHIESCLSIFFLSINH